MVVHIVLFPVYLYRWFISPILPPSCRHTPTCSQYAIEAVKKRGVFVGIYLTINRILRCHPWGTEGHDPVPDKGCKASVNETSKQ
ncbi:MAG: membrane protein insertion efficiency factor YidD [Bacteroidales bacterium]